MFFKKNLDGLCVSQKFIVSSALNLDPSIATPNTAETVTGLSGNNADKNI